MNEPERCAVCGSEMDGYGCLGFSVHDDAVDKQLRSSLAEAKQELDKAKIEIDRLCKLVNAEMADAAKWERQSAEQVEEIIKLRAELAKVTKERSEAQRVAQCLICAGSTEKRYLEAAETALAYKVE